jgi:hypothetical protein
MPDPLSPAETTNNANLSRISHLKTSVSILLRFSSESAGLAVPPKLVEQITPLLRKSPEAMSDDDEVILWKGCDELTRMQRGSTLESAKLTVELADWYAADKPERRALKAANALQRRNHVWIFCTSILLVAYLVVQGYTIVLGAVLDEAKALHTRLESLSQQRITVGSGGNNAAQLAIEEQRLNITVKLESNQKAMERLARWSPIAPAPEADSEKDKAAKDGMQSPRSLSSATTAAAPIETYAGLWRDILLGYLIPACLGMIGAAAYVVRQTCQSVKDSTYIASVAIRDRVRIVQGATFGTLAGVLTAALQTSSTVSIPLMALLCGYNSDIVFRAMDALIIRIRKALEPAEAQTPPPAPAGTQ